MPAIFLSKSYWQVYLDQTAPQIKLLGQGARIGVGSEGGKFGIELSDTGPGLDEVVVRLRQLRSDHELFRKKLGGLNNSKLEINISGQHGVVGEGAGEIEIVAFDRSFYNNRASITAKAFVDTRPPHLEPLSAQHNLRQGGTQLVIYSARDENLVSSGVQVGTSFFEGFPAGQLDSSLNRDGLYAALYTVPLSFDHSKLIPKSDDIKLKVVDIGGNAIEQSFYNKIARRLPRVVGSTNSRLISWLAAFPAGRSDILGESENTETTFSILNHNSSAKKGAAVDAATLVQAFDRIPGTVVLPYGDRIKLQQQTGLETGGCFVFTGVSEARALHAGEVSSIRALDSSFNEVAVNHGLGLFTVYKGIKNVAVREGQQLKSGDLLGSLDSYLALQTLVSGVPVDTTEWWSQDWVTAHIYEKIEEVKKNLGIVVE